MPTFSRTEPWIFLCLFFAAQLASGPPSAHPERASRDGCRDYNAPPPPRPSAGCHRRHIKIRSAGHYPPAAANDVGSWCVTP